jgi:DNA-binding NtrC family response regulator
LELPLLNKLLQQLKSCGHFQPGERTGPIDFRIICGTREDISNGEVNLEAYSEFFRLLAPFQVRIPSLRNRTDDIPLLIKRFLAEVIVGTPRPMPHLTPEAIRLLKTYPWPGNIRELRNVIRQAFLLNGTDEICPDDLPPSIQESRTVPTSETSDGDGGSVREDRPSHEEAIKATSTGNSRKNRDAPFPTLKEAEERLIRQALEHTDWNVKRTASLLKISRPALYRRIEKLKISRHPNTPFTMHEEKSFEGTAQNTSRPIESAVPVEPSRYPERMTP